MDPSTSNARAITFFPASSSAFVIHDLGIVIALLLPMSMMRLIMGMFVSPLCVVVHN